MKFLTFGPFELEKNEPAAIRAFFTRIEEAKENLEKAIGVYIFAIPNDKNELVPLYVGKTDRGFGGRIRKHLDNHKFDEHVSRQCRLNLFLIAKSTSSKKFKKVTLKMRESKKGTKSINELEFALIGSCIELNQNLINKSESTFHRTLRVPGF
jgi:hypothetical protein